MTQKEIYRRTKTQRGATDTNPKGLKGNVTSMTDPLQHTVNYGYDQYNNVISVTDPTNVAGEPYPRYPGKCP